MMKYRMAQRSRRSRSTRGAFTLVEILVALGVMMLLLAIVFVPVNLGLNLFHIGKARSEVSQANQLVLNQLSRELRQAIRVFPNEAMPGIASQPPYSNLSSVAESNTSRIDFLLPAVSSNGSVIVPPRASNYVITYYARRLDTTKAYDVFSNPIVLWRSQYLLSSPNTAEQDKGEPTIALENAGNANSADHLASHTQLTPRDMVLIVSDPATSLQPDSSFLCDDSDGDGKIDRVTMSILLAKYDTIGAGGIGSNGQPRNQQIRLTRTVELPNVK